MGFAFLLKLMTDNREVVSLYFQTYLDRCIVVLEH